MRGRERDGGVEKIKVGGTNGHRRRVVVANRLSTGDGEEEREHEIEWVNERTGNRGGKKE